MKTRALVALPTLGALLMGTQIPVAQAAVPAVGATAATTTASSPVVRARHSTVYNHNWAGYVQKGSTHEVSAVFAVPRLASHPDGYASTWVGIDGYTTRYLTQVGVGEEVVNGHRSTYAWWEVMTPRSMPPMQRFSLAVRPGDAILVRATCGGGRTRVAISNLTTHRSASRVVSYSGPCSSAEWVQEDVNADGRISPAPNWGKVKFSAMTRNLANPRLKASQAHDIIDGHSVHETATSVPNRAGNAFSTKWLRSGSWTSVR